MIEVVGGEEHQEQGEGAHYDGFDADAQACSHLPGGGEGCGSYDGAYDRCHEGFEFAGDDADQVNQQDHSGADKDKGCRFHLEPAAKAYYHSDDLN